ECQLPKLKVAGSIPVARSTSTFLEITMRKFYTLGLFILFSLLPIGIAGQAKLVRYPHYHDGRVVFSYLGDVWTANENGQNIQRLTVNRARDVYPRFSPDG